MRYFLFAVAACMLLACNSSGEKSLEKLLNYSVRKDLGKNQKIDKLVMISVDTFSERDRVTLLLDQAKDVLEGRQHAYERALDREKRGETYKGYIDAEKSYKEMKREVDQLQNTYDHLDGDGRIGLNMKADVYYTFDGVSEKKRLEVEMYEDEYDAVKKANNLLLKKIHADKILGVD